MEWWMWPLALAIILFFYIFRKGIPVLGKSGHWSNNWWSNLRSTTPVSTPTSSPKPWKKIFAWGGVIIFAVATVSAVVYFKPWLWVWQHDAGLTEGYQLPSTIVWGLTWAEAFGSLCLLFLLLVGLWFLLSRMLPSVRAVVPSSKWGWARVIGLALLVVVVILFAPLTLLLAQWAVFKLWLVGLIPASVISLLGVWQLLGIWALLTLLAFKLAGKKPGLLVLVSGLALILYTKSDEISAIGGPRYERPTPTAACPGQAHVVTLTSEWFEFNPGRRCRSLDEGLVGDFVYRDDQGEFPRNGFLSRAATHMRAKNGTAVVKYSLCPLEMRERRLFFDCSPM